jgi:hypothetical protein
LLLLLLLLLLGVAAARPPLFDVLLRVCRITCTRPHTRPQLDEGHDDFVAVMRYNSGDGQCEIRSHGLEKALYCRDFHSHVVVLGLNVVQWLEDNIFHCPVWQDGDCLRDAGGITVGDKGWGRLR